MSRWMRWKQGSKREGSELVLGETLESFGKQLCNGTRVDTTQSLVQKYSAESNDVGTLLAI